MSNESKSIGERIRTLNAALGILAVLGVPISTGSIWLISQTVTWSAGTLQINKRLALCLALANLAFIIVAVIYLLKLRKRLSNARPYVEIISAKYGWGEDVVDMAEILQRKISEGKRKFHITNDLAGKDPLHGSPKSLTVEYLQYGKRQTKTVKEWGTLDFTESA